MEGKCAVTHPTNTTGPKARMTSSSETKKKTSKPKLNRKIPPQKVKNPKTHSQADKGRMKNSLGFLALNMEWRQTKPRINHKYKVMPSVNSLTLLGTGAVLQALWYLQNRAVSQSKLFTTASCYPLWIYFPCALLLYSIAIPFKGNISWPTASPVIISWQLCSGCPGQPSRGSWTVDTSLTRPIVPGNPNQLLVPPAPCKFKYLEVWWVLKGEVFIWHRREHGQAENAGLRGDSRIHSATEVSL